MIAREAGISNGTLFHYFPTKDDLINRLYLFVKDNLFKCSMEGVETELSVQKKLEKIWANMIKWSLNNSNAYHFMQQFAHSPFIDQMTRDVVFEQKKIYGDMINDGKKLGLIRNLPNELIYLITFSTLNGYLQYMETNRMVYSEKSALLGYELLWSAIKADR